MLASGRAEVDLTRALNRRERMGAELGGGFSSVRQAKPDDNTLDKMNDRNRPEPKSRKSRSKKTLIKHAEFQISRHLEASVQC